MFKTRVSYRQGSTKALWLGKVCMAKVKEGSRPFMRTTTTTAVPPDDGSHFLFFHIFVAIWADFCLTTSFHDGCMAFGFWQRMHRHANRCLTLRCPAFTNESFIVTYHWLWHVSMALLHYFIILSFLWSCVVGTHCFVRCLGHRLSSSSSWPPHVRNHPSCRAQVGMLTF